MYIYDYRLPTIFQLPPMLCISNKTAWNWLWKEWKICMPVSLWEKEQDGMMRKEREEKRREPWRQALKVMGLFMDWGCFVHQSTQKRIERKWGGSAAGHLIVIVSSRSRGSAYSLFSFFCSPSSVRPFSPVISSNAAKNAIDIRL